MERKAPKDWQTWADFANCYDLVLFNQCTDLPAVGDAVLDEWREKHNCATAPENSGSCYCEVFQWYAIAVSDDEAEWLNKHFSMDIFYSDTLGIHILPVYHFGTAWDYVPLSMNRDNE